MDSSWRTATLRRNRFQKRLSQVVPLNKENTVAPPPPAEETFFGDYFSRYFGRYF